MQSASRDNRLGPVVFEVGLLVLLALASFAPIVVRTSPFLIAAPAIAPIVGTVAAMLLVGYAVVRWRFGQTPAGGRYRIAIIVGLGVVLIGSALAVQVYAHQRSAPYLYIHDGAVQTEAAVEALAHGQNPYATDYRTTPFGAFPDTFSRATRPNPAWTHYVYPPLQLVLALPIRALTVSAWGWFDTRLVTGLALIVFAAAATRLATDPERRVVVLALALFNPLMTSYFLSGYNDMVFLALVALAALAAARRRVLWAAVALGLAVAAKQTAWFLVPAFLAQVVWSAPPGRRWRAAVPSAGVTAGAALLILGPFFVWSPSNFVDDLLRYPTGGAALSYPISGLGLSQLLLAMGVIRSAWDQFPFWIIQLAVGAPTLWMLLRWQRRSPTVTRMLLAGTILATGLLFCSRYFNDSHLGALSMVALLAFAAQPISRSRSTGTSPSHGT